MDDRIGHFLNFLPAEKGASDNTIAAYRNDLSQFQAYLGTIKLNGSPMDWRRVGKDVIVSYVQELKGRRYAEASVARKVAGAARQAKASRGDARPRDARAALRDRPARDRARVARPRKHLAGPWRSAR